MSEARDALIAEMATEVAGMRWDDRTGDAVARACWAVIQRRCAAARAAAEAAGPAVPKRHRTVPDLSERDLRDIVSALAHYAANFSGPMNGQLLALAMRIRESLPAARERRAGEGEAR